MSRLQLNEVDDTDDLPTGEQDIPAKFKRSYMTTREASRLISDTQGFYPAATWFTPLLRRRTAPPFFRVGVSVYFFRPQAEAFFSAPDLRRRLREIK